MSAEATGWVWRHSPFRGAAFAIHLAIADSVNEQFGHELWMRQHVLASKARTTRGTVNSTLAKMVDLGLIELLQEGSGGANRYRFLEPDDMPVVYESRAPRKPSAVHQPSLGGVSGARTPARRADTEVRAQRAGGVRPARTEPKRTQEVTQQEQTTAPPARALVARVWERCTPRPATPFVGAVKIAERLVAAGWTEHQVEEAMVAAPTISTGAVELVLNRGQQPRRGAAAPVTSRRDGPEGRVEL